MRIIESIEDNIETVEQNYQQKEHLRDYNQATVAARQLLATKAALDLQKYPNIVAKAHLILTYAAYLDGDSALAFSHASEALSNTKKNEKLKLDIYLSMVGGHYAQGRYEELIDVADKAYTLALGLELTDLTMLAMAKKSIGHAMLKQYKEAANTLRQVEPLLTHSIEAQQNQTLLETLSQAYFKMQLYEKALQMQQMLISLIEGTDNQIHIERAYYTLGNIYYQLERYHDAYNAFWGSRSFSLKQASPLKVAYAELGLGKTLIKQGQYQEAEEILNKTESIFKRQNLTLAYLQNLIALAQVNFYLNNPLDAIQLLNQANELSANQTFIDEKLQLYFLLAKIHSSLKDYKSAYDAQAKYLALSQQQQLTHQAAFDNEKSQQVKASEAIESQHNMYDQMVRDRDKSEREQLLSRFIMMLLLTSLVLFIFLVVYVFRFRDHVNKHNQFLVYDENICIAGHEHTKEVYKHAFKQARKFNYPLTVAVVTIDNYSGLHSLLTTQELKDVNGAVARLITELPSETYKFGQLSDSEYLIYFEHQHVKEVSFCFDHLKNGLAQLLFAKVDNNLVTITIGADTLSVSDVDPYQFLARLSLLSQQH